MVSQYDAADPTSLSPNTRERITKALESTHLRSMKALRIGVPVDYLIEELGPEVESTWRASLRLLQDVHGHEIVPIRLPRTKDALAAYYIIAPAEASSNLARYDGVRYGWRPDSDDGAGNALYSNTRDAGFGDEVRRRILLGSYSLSSEAMDNYFIKAQRIRRMIVDEFNATFAMPNPMRSHQGGSHQNEDGIDFIVCPTASSLPPTHDQLNDLSPVQAV